MRGRVRRATARARRMALGGFSVVDRARLKTLSGNVLAQLVQSDELELIYAHLVSMRNFATVRDRPRQDAARAWRGRRPANPLARRAQELRWNCSACWELL